MSDQWSVRVVVQAPDGRIFNYAWESRSRQDAVGEVRAAAHTLADTDADESTFASPDVISQHIQALFTYRHLGWGLEEPRLAADLVAEDGA